MKLFLFNNDEKLIGTVSPLEGIQNEEINKIQTIECTVVYSELIEKASYIGHKDYSDNRIFHLYKIDHVTKTSTTDVKIVGVHTFFDDMESDGYVKDFRPTNRELVGVLTTILDGSRWQLGTVNIQRRYTGNFYYVTRKEAISKLIEATQIEIKPRLEFSRGKITGRYLDVFTRLGARNGKVFVHGRDLLTVSEKKSQGAIYTAIVGRGKGEETDTGGYGRRISFKDVEWRRTSGQPVDKPVGQEYVEIPAMTKLYGFEKGTKPRIKIVEFQDEADKEKLLRLSYEWLEKNSRMQVEYSAKVLNVGNLELGDTVGIFNPKLGIKYETRVFKVKRNLVDNKLTEFGIGDKVTTSPFSRTIELAKEMKNFQDDTVYWLDKIRERLSDKLINEDGYNYDLKADNEYKVPAGFYSFDKPIDQKPTKVVYMGAGKIAIANSKKPTGEWNWKTFLDGTGATLDLINTGVLRAGRIQSADGRSYWDLDTGEFHMEQSAINEAVKTVVNGKVQEIVGEVKKNLPTKEELKGKSSYLHKKYSDYADGRNMSDNSTLKYIGIYTGDKQQAPTNASEYSWTKIRGEDGERGRDGVDGKSINENLLPNSNFAKELENWEMPRLINSGLNWQKGHAIYHFGRGLHIWGTPNGNDKGLGSMFNFIAKQGEKITLSMDLGKDALNNYSTLFLGVHYIGEDNTIKAQEWQQLDLTTIGLELKKYKRISKTFTVGSDMKKCRLMIHCKPQQLANFYIDNIKLERGEVATEWSPAYEDLRGRDGVSNYIHRKYSDSSNGANMDDNSNRKYIGIYTGTSPTPPTTASSYLWSKIKGEDGANGVPGAKGADGRTPYFHTAYSNSPTGDRDFSTINSNDKLYIGTYSDFEIADSTDYRKYKWVKIKGEDGRNGVSSYIYRKYSDNANGSPMSDNSNLKYIGIYTGTSATAPTTPSAYTWSKIKGEDGAQGVPGARGSDGRTSYLHTAYANSVTGDRDFSTTNSNGKEYIGTYTDFEINDSNDYRRYKWVKIKGENGRNGTDGHSLTANVRFEGSYVNNNLTDLNTFVDVFYDGQKITQGFELRLKHRGIGLANWTDFISRTYDNTGRLTNFSFSNGERDGTPLEVIALVTYKGLNTIANARMENVPDVVEIKEVVKKYKTFESTLEGFTSVVGEINTKVLTKQQNRQNLNSEDVEKTGNDLYFNAKENLQANEYYTILADLDNVPANQKAKIYSASDGGDEKLIQNGLNYWVVKYPNNRGSINLYPLGANTKVKNVRIFKGDFRVKKDDERENLYSSSATDSGDKFIHLNLIKNKINGNVYTVKFDASGYSNGDRWDIYNRIGYNQENLTQVFKTKDNEFTFTINDNTTDDRIYMRMIQVGNTKISNVEIYDVTLGYAKNKEVSKLESSIKQTKDEIDLKVSKDNVIAAINASVETTGEGPAQGVVKINADKVDIRGVLSAYTGLIGGFRIGRNPNDGGFWLTGQSNFDCGINPGHNAGSNGAQLWAAWGNLWTSAGPNAWWVTAQGIMVCKNTPTFHKGMEVYGRYIDMHGNDIQGDKSGGGKTSVVWWSQINKANSSSSDKRLKTNIKPTKIKALETLNNIEMVEFNWKKDNKFEKIGAIAQQVQSIEESFVVQDMDDKQTYNDYLRISYYNTIPYLIKAIQELSTENQQLKSQLKEMNERLQKLEDKINGNL
nr:MAG TPA: tail protein [Caudoviricetes sp.]